MRPPVAAYELPLPDEFPTLSFEGFNELIEHGQHKVGYSNDDVGYMYLGSIWNYKLQRGSKLKHAAARRLKKKALLHLRKRSKKRSLVQSAQQNKGV